MAFRKSGTPLPAVPVGILNEERLRLLRSHGATTVESAIGLLRSTPSAATLLALSADDAQQLGRQLMALLPATRQLELEQASTRAVGRALGAHPSPPTSSR